MKVRTALFHGVCGRFGLQVHIPYDKIVKIRKKKRIREKLEETYHDSETDFKYPEDKRSDRCWS